MSVGLFGKGLFAHDISSVSSVSSVSTDITASGNGTPASLLSFNQPLGLGVDGGSTAIATGEKNAKRRFKWVD